MNVWRSATFWKLWAWQATQPTCLTLDQDLLLQILCAHCQYGALQGLFLDLTFPTCRFIVIWQAFSPGILILLIRGKKNRFWLYHPLCLLSLLIYYLNTSWQYPETKSITCHWLTRLRRTLLFEKKKRKRAPRLWNTLLDDSVMP